MCKIGHCDDKRVDFKCFKCGEIRSECECEEDQDE